MKNERMATRWQVQLGVLLAIAFSLTCGSAERELIADPHFERGFYLLEPRPGKRVVCGELEGLRLDSPIWDLAQWSSRLPLKTADRSRTSQTVVWSNSAKTIVLGKPGNVEADLSLAVNAGVEYPHARKSTGEPWVHLLVQQELKEPPALDPLNALKFHMEGRLVRSRLVSTNDYSPSIHAAQFLVYLTVANRNPKAAGYQECFWFGVPVYDNRERVISAYEAQDFGETKLFIFTPSSDTFASKSTHDGDWVTFEKDLLPLMRQSLDRARSRGFIKGSSHLADYRPLGIFIGWEVPGRFDVAFQIRNLSLKTVPLIHRSPTNEPSCSPIPPATLKSGS